MKKLYYNDGCSPQDSKQNINEAVYVNESEKVVLPTGACPARNCGATSKVGHNEAFKKKNEL